MKVVLFIHSLATGGAERVAATLATLWAEEGHEVSLVTLAPVSEDRYRLPRSVTRISLDQARESRGALGAMAGNLRRIHSLRKVLRRERPQAVVAMLTSANVLLAAAGLGLSGIVRVGSERSYPPHVPLRRVWEWLRRRSYGWLDAVVAVTGETRDWLLAHTSAKRVEVIPNPVTWPLAAYQPTLAPALTGVCGRYRLLAVGRLGPEKRYDRLIEVFARLAPMFPGWELVILGDGPERSVLVERVEALGMGGVVLLPGQAGNVGDWYESADLFVLCSRFEGFPNVLVEAMAHGLPVVSVDCDTGPRDIVRHEVDGVLVPPQDDPALEAALRRMMADPESRARLGTRATEVRERFAPSQVNRLWQQLFVSVTR